MEKKSVVDIDGYTYNISENRFNTMEHKKPYGHIYKSFTERKERRK